MVATANLLAQAVQVASLGLNYSPVSILLIMTHSTVFSTVVLKCSLVRCEVFKGCMNCIIAEIPHEFCAVFQWTNLSGCQSPCAGNTKMMHSHHRAVTVLKLAYILMYCD